MRYAGCTVCEVLRQALRQGDDGLYWILAVVCVVCVLLVVTRRKPDTPNVGHLVSDKEQEPDSAGDSTLGTGELLFGDAAATPPPKEVDSTLAQPPPVVPGVYFGGGVALNAYAEAHGVVDMPGILLSGLDPTPLSQSDTQP